ncbi:hypothetical protein HBI82_025670 [Parastagonospora nodorum]|nr:hypothetical protein HBI82_025670 [Parastagonospora nodorum]
MMNDVCYTEVLEQVGEHRNQMLIDQLVYPDIILGFDVLRHGAYNNTDVPARVCRAKPVPLVAAKLIRSKDLRRSISTCSKSHISGMMRRAGFHNWKVATHFKCEPLNPGMLKTDLTNTKPDLTAHKTQSID